MERKDPEDMSEDELKEELKRMYKELNDLSASQMESLDFTGRVILEKKNEDDELVEKHEVEL